MTTLSNRIESYKSHDSDELADIGILLVTKDDYLSKRLLNIFKNSGQRATVCNSRTKLHNFLKYFVPKIVLMDSNLLDDKCKVLLHAMQEKSDKQIPCIFFDDEYDTKRHLECVMSGGVAYFTKPIEVEKLIEIVVEYSTCRQDEPDRIIIIDDDKAMSSYYAAILSKENMKVTCCDKPLDVVRVLNEFKPDLILLDLYMPECSGIELARLIRQLDSFTSVPIVFLSGESDIQKQLMGLSQGADEFLNKDIKPWHLVSAVKSRCQRSKTLRTIMDSDPLTGFLNKNIFYSQLESEISRSIRQKCNLSVAMIDIDNFKSINDKYGHMVGDKILKFLASILKTRLRASDIVARFGGEEFMVLLKDTDKESANIVIKNVLEAFSSYTHTYGNEEFYVTFSCGVTDLNESKKIDSLIEQADKSLYEAKGTGKNKIVNFT